MDLTQVLTASPTAPETIEVPPDTPAWQSDLPRRRFIRAAAGATGLALGSGLWGPLLGHAHASGSTLPRHIRGGIRPFGPGTKLYHVFLPGPGAEPATIRDFRGHVGVAAAKGFGTGVHTATGTKVKLAYDVDLRFFKGHYVGRDGNTHHGTFGFV
jgi:hypothetical protein